MKTFLAQIEVVDDLDAATVSYFQQYQADDAEHAREQADDACGAVANEECIAIFERVWANDTSDVIA